MTRNFLPIGSGRPLAGGAEFSYAEIRMRLLLPLWNAHYKGNSSKYRYINDSSGDAYKYLHKPEGAGAICGNLSDLSEFSIAITGKGNPVDDPGYGTAEVSDVW
jgi:hypothetical protein